jgi:hypothetical protein
MQMLGAFARRAISVRSVVETGRPARVGLVTFYDGGAIRHAGFDAELAQGVHGVRPECNTGTDFANGVGAFEDEAFDADAAQGYGGG